MLVTLSGIISFVKPSHLGLELAKDKHASMGMDERNLMDGFTIKNEQIKEFDDTWQPVWGETKDIRNHYVSFLPTRAADHHPLSSL